MSMLTPLYVLGLLAVSLPVIFHLIRRMPRGDFQFSSLMFLSASPPRLARRSRLEHLLLLLLRGLALGLLAFAFARPFLRQDAPLAPPDGQQRRVAIVVDTSASMRRGDLWRQATTEVDKLMAEIRPFDQVAVFTCDDLLRPLITFEDMSHIAPAQRRAVVARRLQGISPTWAATHLGQGLMDTVDVVNNVSETSDESRPIARRIVLVSDVQEGGRLSALADYPWPEDVELELRPVSPAENTNAGLHRLADRLPADSDATSTHLRVRVSNDAQSAADEFRLAWIDEADRTIGEPVEAYVPSGESRVVRIARPADSANAHRLRLSGDDCDFDNMLYLAARSETETSVVYLGTDRADDPQGLRYYIERALTEGLSRPVKLVAASPDEPLDLRPPAEMPLLVVVTVPSDDQLRALREYADAGGSVLVVLTRPESAVGLAKLAGIPALDVEEASVDGYTMLGQIAFDHPLFAPMAGPHFNDFTQIHFWKYRRFKNGQMAGANIVARFENGDPALVEWRPGKGRVFALASGWQPGDSQLARSWKFVLLVSALVDGSRSGGTDRVYFTINEPVPLGGREEFGPSLVVAKPDGTKAPLSAEARSFVDTNMPGVYSITAADGSHSFAVNLDPLESKTASLGAETLEQLGCRLVSPTAVANNDALRRHLQDVQLESRQKLWQWLIVAALAVLVAETWLAGRATKPALTEGVPA